MMLIRLLLAAVISSSVCYSWSLRDFIVPHFESRYRPKCQRSGELCKFDRHCCAGLECRIDGHDYDLGYFCLSRLVDDTYVEFTGGPSWKDYQEPRSDLAEYEGPRSLNSEELYKRNEELQRKLEALRLLRKTVKQQQLKDVKRRLEEAEIEVLRDRKKKYEEKTNRELIKLREKELENNLLEMEKQEVNRTVMRQNRISDVSLNMPGDFEPLQENTNVY